SLLKTLFAATLALWARCRCAARRRARPVAAFAGLQPWDFDRRFDALRRFFERDFQVVPQIAAALRTAAASSAKKVAEDAAEDIFEPGEGRGIEAGSRLRRHTRVTEPIVAGAFFGVRKNGVGLGRLLEFLFGGLVALIAVRMILKRELAVRALDL